MNGLCASKICVMDYDAVVTGINAFGPCGYTVRSVTLKSGATVE